MERGSPLKRFAKQEMGATTLFVAACGWLVVDMMQAEAVSSPSLYPIIPMSVATLWYVAIEFQRARNTV